MTSIAASTRIGRRMSLVGPGRQTLVGIAVASGALGALIAWQPAVGFAGLASLIILLALAARPILGCYAVILALPLTIGLAKGRILSMLRVSDVVLLLAVGAYLLWRSGRADKRMRLDRIDVGYGCLLVFGSLLPLYVALQRGEQLFSVDIVQLLGPVEYVLVYRLVAGSLVTARQVRVALWLVALASALVAALGILQSLSTAVLHFLITFYPVDSDTLVAANTQALSHRAVSVLRVPQALAAYGIYAATLIVLYLQAKPAPLTRRGRVLLGVVVILDLIASLATLSVTAIIALFVALFMIGRVTRRLGKYLGVVIGILVLAAVAFGPFIDARFAYLFAGGGTRYAQASVVPSTWSVRWSHWTDVFWPVIRPHLLLGVRPTISPDLSWHSFESFYLGLLYRGGLLLLAAFIVFAILVLRRARALQQSPDPMTRTLAQAVTIIMAVNLILDVFDTHFFMAGEPELIAMVLGMLTAAARSQVTHPDREGENSSQLASRSSVMLVRPQSPSRTKQAVRHYQAVRAYEERKL